uniref:Uncharacterized protein n=1 Tax=Oryza sativa subsp. japonica TaxID=39947 RepID=Q688F0_ORYSJ|nr:hypothetical protein [Oryza sativa Japonica Group]
MEVTLTQMEMAKVVVTTTGGEVEDDGEAEDLSLGFFGSGMVSVAGRRDEGQRKGELERLPGGSRAKQTRLGHRQEYRPNPTYGRNLRDSEDDERERLDGGTNATTIGNDERTRTTTTGAGEGATRDSQQWLHGDGDDVEHAAAMTMTEAAPRDDEPGDRWDVDRRGRTVTRKRRCQQRLRGGGDGVEHAAAMLVKVVVQRGDEPTRRNGWLARRRRSGELRATLQPGRRRGWRYRTDRGGSDVGRRSGEAAGMAGAGGVVATPLVVGEDASPVISPRNGGEAGKEEAAATPGEVAAQPEGARARREVRLEVAGVEEREGRRRKRSSGGHRAKRRVGRGRGGGCDAVGGDGAIGRRSGEEGEAAGGGRRHGRERRTAGRWLGTTGRLGMGLKR